jgi:hypothetical protein
MDKDKDELHDLFAVSLIDERVIYHADLDFEVEDADAELVIMDEGDEYLYN